MPRKAISRSIVQSDLTPEQLDKGVVEVKVTGTPEAVEKAGIAIQDGTTRSIAPVASETTESDEFSKHLRNPKYLVRVKRISPRVWEGQRINHEVYTQECPLSLQDIQEEVFGQHGGRKFRVAITDPESGQTVAARVIENDADPILPEMDEEEEGVRMLMEASQPDAGQVSEQILDQQAKITAKQLQVETLQQQLDAVRAKRSSVGKSDPAVDHKIEMLERRLSDAKYEQEIERIRLDSQHKVEMLQKQIELLSQKLNQPAQAQESTNLLIKVIEDSNKRFDALLAQMRDDKLNSIIRDISAIKNMPSKEGGALKDLVEIVEMVDRIREGSGGVEEDDENKPWYEKLADKYLPRLFDLIEEDRRAGKPVPTKEELVRRIEAEADRAVKEEMARRRAMQQQQQQQTSTPAATLPPKPDALPPPALPENVQSGGTTASQTAPITVENLPSIEEEVKLRAGQVMSLINREMMIRPREYNWNYVAFQGLPEEILAKMATAPDPAAMISAFDGVLNPAGLDQVKQKIAADPNLSAWLGRGLKKLRQWWDKSQFDPDFDPDDDGGDEEEPDDVE